MGKLGGHVTRRYQIKELQDRHHAVLRLIALGWKPTDIAEYLGFTPEMISIIKNSGVAKDVIEVMRGAADIAAIDVAQEIKKLAPRAVQLLEKAIDNELVDGAAITAKGLSAAKEILDREAPKVQKGQFDVLHRHALTDEDMEEIRRRARLAGILTEPSSGVIDVTPNEGSETLVQIGGTYGTK